MMRSRMAQQDAEAAKEPTESKLTDSGSTPSLGMRDAVGLHPTKPHIAAGMRQEPPVSVPMAAAAMPSVTDTAAPEEEPPGMRLTSRW